jgi:hypothetical protein
VSRPAPVSVDRRGVDAALGDVLTGLRTATGIRPGEAVGRTAKALADASAEFVAAGAGLAPAPAGVPESAAAPAAIRLAQLGRLFRQAADCMTRQSRKATPEAKACLPPLRRANANDSRLAHELINVSAYGSMSPKTFESRLVKALK